MKQPTLKTRYGEMYNTRLSFTPRVSADINTLFGGDDEVYEPKVHPGEITTLVCPDCGSPLQLKEGVRGLFYGCSTHPACAGTHGANKDGSPVGIPGDKATRKARKTLHEIFDRLWMYHEGKRPVMDRRQAYTWLQRAMDLPPMTGIGHLSLEQCRKLQQLLREQFPHIFNYWEKLLEEDVV